MKKQVFFSFIILLAFATVSFAQKRPKKGKKTPEEVAQKRTDKMAEVMELDATIKAKVYTINLTAAKELKAIRDRVKAAYPDKESRKANKEKIKETYGPQKKKAKKTRKDALKKSGITEEQWKKWKEYKKSQREKKRSKKDDDME